MTWPIAYDLEVRDDVRNAVRSYGDRSPRLVERFLAVVEEATAALSQNPELYGFVHDEIRALRLRPFPYVLYYVTEPHQVYVLAIQHGSRDPALWQGRWNPGQPKD